KENHPDDYQIDTLDMLNPNWKDYDFSGYDTVFHVAGIAHQKETKENAHLYYEVNRDLAIETANISKESGVRQFIFMSSMSVYGLDCSDELINLQTPTHPKTNYGKSKLEAEQEIMLLSDETFDVCILRPPMVYGENSPGNLTRLFKIVRKVHVFPTIKNKRSSISIDKLSEEIEEVINHNIKGIILPQNDEYMCTFEIVRNQMMKENVKIVYMSVFNPIIYRLIGRVGLITKCFGDLMYSYLDRGCE
ncbi:MAG: NAD-dependent epimerase/dehydratase family protein, partial [Massilimicrobiota sp.]|nr:NAD-dependent epimerase/dehydratase family protein [Massilimicrobiota sp.]